MLDVVEILRGDLVDSVDVFVEVFEDDGHVEVFQVVTDAFQVDDFDIFRVDDQRRELDEFDQARGGRDDSRGRFVRDPVEG